VEFARRAEASGGGEPEEFLNQGSPFGLVLPFSRGSIVPRALGFSGLARLRELLPLQARNLFTESHGPQ
jgi:hypothetical protein